MHSGKANAIEMMAKRSAHFPVSRLPISVLPNTAAPINRALWLFGVVQLVSIFGFAWLASLGHHAEIGALERIQLALVIGLEALGVGLGTVAFVAFMAHSTHPAYTATQFALFTSLMAMPRTFANAATGWLLESMGWTNFFLFCALLATPGMVLLFKVAPWSNPPQNRSTDLS